MNTASLIGFLVLVFTLVGLVFRGSILGEGTVAITIQILAVLLMIWARATFGRRSFHASANPTDGGLVTTGPYRVLRHPIYASILFFLWAAVFSHISATNICLGLVGTAGAAIRIYTEERLLLIRYPEYREYAARTKRIIPFLL